MEFIKNKKGVSDVITTVLIILLVLAAVAIIGGILLRNISQAGGKIETSTGCIELDLQPVSCTTFGVGSATVLVQRGSRGSNLQISKLIAVIEKSDGTTATGNAITIPSALSTSIIPVFSVTKANAKKARVSATLQGTDGSEQTCELTNVVVECKGVGSGTGEVRVSVSGGSVSSVTEETEGSGYIAGTVFPFNCATPALIRITSVTSTGGLQDGGFTILNAGSGCTTGDVEVLL